MASKLFVTGVTGYIGGDAIFAIAKAHPELEIACLVRNSDKGAQVASQYSKIRLVHGSLDDTDKLEKEAQKADIVLNFANADHDGAAKALVKGLSLRDGDAPGFLIHTSGTGILMVKDIENKSYGEDSTKVYDDWDGVSEVTSLPDFAPHRAVDKIVLEGNSAKTRTAIVCPPTIYGIGRGPGNQRGHQLYELARCTLEKQEGLQFGAGKTRWTNVHVHDLSKCYLELIEAAVQGGGNATWGKDGYYFTENGEHVWGEVSKRVAKEAHKQDFIPSNETSIISAEEANQLTRAGAYLWAANSRCKAIRARKVLGWTPTEKDMENEIPLAVATEAKRLGLDPGHAAKVAG